MIRTALASTVLLSLTGCGTLCDRIDSFITNYKSRHQACTEVVNNTLFDAQVCEQKLGNCTSAEQDKIIKYMDCAEKLPACTSDTFGTTWMAANMKCIQDSGIDTLSDACNEAF